ncbi:MAG: hypothetical protein L3K23_02835 [Thermoplasmata archaeon]|nr:hypothetical protein [Thermoplasmata archaeon]
MHATKPNSSGEFEEHAPRNGQVCELSEAMTYGWEVYAGGEVVARSDCGQTPAFDVMVYRQGAAAQGPVLAWRVFGICDSHLPRIFDLDDAARVAEDSPPDLAPRVLGAVR